MCSCLMLKYFIQATSISDKVVSCKQILGKHVFINTVISVPEICISCFIKILKPSVKHQLVSTVSKWSVGGFW